ncbi:nucleotidyltransferase family protein [uncultured Devosia sp.]|uniref:nucleotidyltransferase family protein n=1 Tax=uncultured Devosia sp. TaxID=211434 RepID=UPI0035CBF5AC
MVVTVPERKTRKVQQLREAAVVAIADLRAYAIQHAGHFIIFGSVARNDIRFDSDFDVVVDFPGELGPQARDYVETLCTGLGLCADAYFIAEIGQDLRLRIDRDGIMLP